MLTGNGFIQDENGDRFPIRYRLHEQHINPVGPNSPAHGFIESDELLLIELLAQANKRLVLYLADGSTLQVTLQLKGKVQGLGPIQPAL
jgi:hypothetical protein